jgi:hypothetical protein
MWHHTHRQRHVRPQHRLVPPLPTLKEVKMAWLVDKEAQRTQREITHSPQMPPCDKLSNEPF